MATEESPAQLLPTTLPIPPDFPVTWEQPEDAQLFWTFDPTLPDAMPPLDLCVRARQLAGLQRCRGSLRAADAPGDPLISIRYLYQAAHPIERRPAGSVVQALDTRSEGQLASAR